MSKIKSNNQKIKIINKKLNNQMQTKLLRKVKIKINMNIKKKNNKTPTKINFYKLNF